MNFDETVLLFTNRVKFAAEWKHNYAGAAYATRVRAAIADLRIAISEAEQNPEIGGHK